VENDVVALEMERSDADWPEWVRKNKVAFELAPLVEMRGSDKLQVGFTFSLYAAAPMDEEPGSERHLAGDALKQELLALAKLALGSEERVARTELEPPRTVVLRPENELKPEVCLSWRIFHKDEYLQPVTAAEREGLTEFEKRLHELGLKRGHW
jgi:hypothetical protein